MRKKSIYPVLSDSREQASRNVKGMELLACLRDLATTGSGHHGETVECLRQRLLNPVHTE